MNTTRTPILKMLVPILLAGAPLWAQDPPPPPPFEGMDPGILIEMIQGEGRGGEDHGGERRDDGGDGAGPTTQRLDLDALPPPRSILPLQEGDVDPAADFPEGPEPEITLNFQGAPIDAVLDHLSKAAGFIVVREVDVSGTVDIRSLQPMGRDQAVTLLNTVLFERGYQAIRKGRLLIIVDRDDAARRSIPVRAGSDPDDIPDTDEMVTQIMPVKFADATRLVDNLQPLLPSYAIISANESSNAIVLTDTQSNVRRIARIVQSLDTSISQITSLQVFMLKYSDATEMATLITKLFEQPSSSRSSRGGGDPRAEFFARMRGESGPSNSSSDARRAQTRVVAAADERTNAVVVSAPEELLPTIEKLVEEMDQMTESLTMVRVFPLQYADAEEMADLVTEVFLGNQSGRSRSQQSSSRFGGFFGRFGGGPPGSQQRSSSSSTDDIELTAVADTRTNSVVVTATTEIMDEVAQVIDSLDTNPAKSQKVYLYELKNANPETVSDILGQVMNQQGSRSGTTNRSSNTNRRTSNSNTSRNSSRSNTGSSRNSSSGRTR